MRLQPRPSVSAPLEWCKTVHTLVPKCAAIGSLLVDRPSPMCDNRGSAKMDFAMVAARRHGI
eukprot:7560415-Alexandrium_andersonii.AAC.1